MIPATDSEPGLPLSGLDGANLLGFLAALGTARGLAMTLPEHRVCLYWQAVDAWRPSIQLDGEATSPEFILDTLDRFLAERPGHDSLGIGNNLNLEESRFREHASVAAKASSPIGSERAAADFIAAFGCDAITDDKGIVRDTALRTMQGAGHQHFLKTMRDLVEATSREAIERCLFAPWTRPDSRLSLRWDPEDDRRYALRWRDPTAPGEEPKTEWGANRLAFEALPFFPVLPNGKTSVTTGFSVRNRATILTWPIWTAPASVDVIRSMLALRELQELDEVALDAGATEHRRQQDRERQQAPRDRLREMGIAEVFRSRRLNVGQYRNFSPARPV